jgi:hypothetical protein
LTLWDPGIPVLLVLKVIPVYKAIPVPVFKVTRERQEWQAIPALKGTLGSKEILAQVYKEIRELLAPKAIPEYRGIQDLESREIRERQDPKVTPVRKVTPGLAYRAILAHKAPPATLAHKAIPGLVSKVTQVPPERRVILAYKVIRGLVYKAIQEPPVQQVTREHKGIRVLRVTRGLAPKVTQA